MKTVELLMLAQTVILFLTGVTVLFYTWETRKMRAVATGQFQVMRRTLELQFEEQKRAAEPIFVWNGGSCGPNHLEWSFVNEGGPISYIEIVLRHGAPEKVVAEITPTDWIGQGRQGTIKFKGEITQQIPFNIGFRTGIGSVGAFFFVTNKGQKPLLTGSGWV